MNRSNMPTSGFRLLLQALAQKYPQLTLLNLNKFIEARNSYQHRSNICSVILWSASQAGYYDVNVGLKVWLSLMVPVVSIKAYTKQVVNVFEKLMNVHENLADSKNNIDVRDFFPILDFIYTSTGLPNNLTIQLKSSFHKLKKLAYGSQSENVVNAFFPSYLCRLNSNADSFREEILPNLIICLAKDRNCFKVWQKMYSNSLIQSKCLLKYLDDNWPVCSSRVNKKLLKETLTLFKLANQQLLGCNKPSEIEECDYYTKVSLIKNQNLIIYFAHL